MHRYRFYKDGSICYKSVVVAFPYALGYTPSSSTIVELLTILP